MRRQPRELTAQEKIETNELRIELEQYRFPVRKQKITLSSNREITLCTKENNFVNIQEKKYTWKHSLRSTVRSMKNTLRITQQTN
jgi:hypothetical protein